MGKVPGERQEAGVKASRGQPGLMWKVSKDGKGREECFWIAARDSREGSLRAAKDGKEGSWRVTRHSG